MFQNIGRGAPKIGVPNSIPVILYQAKQQIAKEYDK
jgi:hypothetical protein